MSEQVKQAKTGSKKRILCPLCNDGILKKHGGHGLCRKHYRKKYHEAKKEKASAVAGDGSGTALPPLEPGKIQWAPDPPYGIGIAGLFDSPADVELRSWLVADMRAERRNRLEDHILYILDVYRAGKINQEAGR